MRNLSDQRGVSLIELMVGLTIGLLLAVIASATYLYSKQNFNTTSETAQAEENGRFALNLLARHIQNAGFVMIDPASSNPQGAKDDRISGCDFGYTDTSQTPNFTCLTSTPVGQLPSSSFKTIFETDVPATSGGNFEGADCIGNQAQPVVVAGVTKTYQVTSYFFISSTVTRTEYGTTTMGQLSCLPGNLTNGAAQLSQPLIPGIVQMDVNYITGTDPNTAKTLANAAAVTAANNWAQVSAVELCVLSKTNLQQSDLARSYTDCRGNAIVSEPNAIYRTFRTRVNLRNIPLS
jgi:type IV pilus assembly protein PilW